MTAPILVGYASRYGSTQEVAAEITKTLLSNGFDVTLKPLRDINSIDDHGAVIIGAPLYMGRLHGDVAQFLAWHREALADHPVAVFALGPLSVEPKEVDDARQQLDRELAKYSWLTPVDVALFGGKYDPEHLNFLHRLMAQLPMTPLHGLPAKDARDWAATRTWADGLAQSLETAAPR